MHKCCAASSAACERTFARTILSAPAAMRVSIISFLKKNKGGLSCAVLFAVRCGAYPSDKPLTVECLVRSSDGGGVLQSAGSIISFYTKLNILKGEGGNPAHKAVLRAAQHASAPSP